jgi:hypothetical protein
MVGCKPQDAFIDYMNMPPKVAGANAAERLGFAAMKHHVRIIATTALLAIIPAVHAGKAKPFIFAPTNGTGPFPVALWLHG